MERRSREYKAANGSKPGLEDSDANTARKPTTGAMSGERSVKSIVAWIESPKQNDFRSSAAKNSITTMTKPDMRLSSVGEQRYESRAFVPRSPEIEDDSLTLVKYKDFFAQKPLGRCLDGVTEDLSKLSLQDIFARAGRTERAIVSIDRGEKPVMMKSEVTKMTSCLKETTTTTSSSEAGERPSAEGGETF